MAGRHANGAFQPSRNGLACPVCMGLTMRHLEQPLLILKQLFESYRNLIYLSIAICVIG